MVQNYQLKECEGSYYQIIIHTTQKNIKHYCFIWLASFVWLVLCLWCSLYWLLSQLPSPMSPLLSLSIFRSIVPSPNFHPECVTGNLADWLYLCLGARLTYRHSDGSNQFFWNFNFRQYFAQKPRVPYCRILVWCQRILDEHQRSHHILYLSFTKIPNNPLLKSLNNPALLRQIAQIKLP